LRDESVTQDPSQVHYRIVAIEARDSETALRLQRLDLDSPSGFSQLIESLVERYQGKYKLDVEDEYQSILSWYYERCYAQSAVQIPFYVEQDEASEPLVQAVAVSEGNLHLVRFFYTDEDNYNFTPICLPHRLKRLEAGESFVLAMYRWRGEGDQCMRIYSAADFEFSEPGDFQSFVSYALSRPEYSIVKVQVGRIPSVSLPQGKVDEVARRLQHKSEAQMLVLRERLQRLNFMASLTDVTQEYSEGVERNDDQSECSGELAAWVGCERREIAGGTLKEKLAVAQENLHPELIRFGCVERRREDRYLAETKVDVNAGGKKFSGMTVDISTRGMRIQLNKRIKIKPGTSVRVGLVSLQQKKSSTNLMDIPYRVVRSRDEEEGTVLMLERVMGGNKEGLKEFFVELISKNQHKLGVDIGDIWSATASRVYEALLVANTPTIPFFLARDTEGSAQLQFVGMPEAGNTLVDFFLGDGGVDFRGLNERRVVTALYDAVQIQLRQSRNSAERPTPFELKLYLFKDYDEATGETFIHAVSELDFSNDGAGEAFLESLSNYEDWRCIKIVSTFTHPIDEKALDKMIDSVRTQSKHRAIKLSDLAHSVVGYGELVDVTREWESLHPPS
jgi:hypothetical protein